nr:arginine repressor [Maliibacterium massiliense]
MKSNRHTMILDIIRKMDIATQEELAEQLRQRGVVATQATISRDIKELHLIKVLGSNGIYKYAMLEQNDGTIDARLMRLFNESVLTVTSANNLIVLGTISGSANAAAKAIDSLAWDEIIGTLAGDDTILVIVDNNEDAEAVVARFRQMMQ